MKKKITIDFYKIVIADDRKFSDIIKEIATLDSPDDKNLTLQNDDVILLQKHKAVSNFVVGNMIRIRMHELPVRARIDGIVEDFDLSSDEGVGEQTAFLFDPKFNVILLQRSRSGVSSGNFTHYFYTRSDLKTLQLEPVLEPDVLKRIEKLAEVRRFEFKVASVNNMSFFGAHATDLSIKAFDKLMTDYKSPTIEMVLSVGRKRNVSLDTNSVLGTIKNLFRLTPKTRGGPLHKLSVTGVTDNEEIDIINVLKAQMSEEIIVDAVGTRNIRFENRVRALLAAHINRRTDLEEQFGEP